MVNLTTLTPDIVAAILDEILPPDVTLFDLVVDTPALWEGAGAVWGIARAPIYSLDINVPSRFIHRTPSPSARACGHDTDAPTGRSPARSRAHSGLRLPGW